MCNRTYDMRWGHIAWEHAGTVGIMFSWSEHESVLCYHVCVIMYAHFNIRSEHDSRERTCPACMYCYLVDVYPPNPFDIACTSNDVFVLVQVNDAPTDDANLTTLI